MTEQCHVQLNCFIFWSVQLKTEVGQLCTSSVSRLGFKRMPSRFWQYISCHLESCSTHLAISDFTSGSISVINLQVSVTQQCHDITCTIELFQTDRKCHNRIIAIYNYHGFASITKIKLRKSTFPAGMLVTYKAYAGSKNLVAVIAGKGLVGVWCYGCTIFPPLTFFLYGRPPVGFKGGGSFAYSVTPCAAVFGEGSPLKVADVACTKVLF